jgi:diguanylate cyclase (GGDEF)-like protein
VTLDGCLKTKNGLVVRYRGDEFLAILPECRAETALVLPEEVRKLIFDSEIAITIGRSSQTIHSSLSGGMATFSTDASDPIGLVRKADEAMVRAKQTGR